MFHMFLLVALYLLPSDGRAAWAPAAQPMLALCITAARPVVFDLCG